MDPASSFNHLIWGREGRKGDPKFLKAQVQTLLHRESLTVFTSISSHHIPNLYGCEWEKYQIKPIVAVPGQVHPGCWLRVDRTRARSPTGQPTCQHLPPFCNSISFFACSKMLLMASSEPVSGVLIRGVMLPDQRGRKTVLSPVLVLQAPLVCQEVFTAPHVQLFLGMLDLRQMSLPISR